MMLISMCPIPWYSQTMMTSHTWQKDYDISYKNWEISKEMINSKIQAYFSDNRINTSPY